MAIGIWTPVLLSAKQVTFPDLLNVFANKVKQVSPTAGAHVRFTLLGCFPVYVHTSAPANDAAGLTGIPIGPESQVVVPHAANLWIYSPYEMGTVIVDTGTLT